mgnify:CR=1 FL=1
MNKITDIKSDRMRYTRNSISATFSYIAILFNALYFLNIYHSDVGKFYYKIDIGASVVYNLLFMLFVFLASEAVKKYDMTYSVVLIVIGAMQIVRIFGIPLDAFTSTIEVKRDEVQVMELDQFITCIIFLAVSAGFAIAAGVIGVRKTKKLRNYEKSLITE